MEAFWHEAGVRGGSDSACLPSCLHVFYFLFFIFFAAVAFELVGVVTLASKLTGLQHGRFQCV